MFLQICTGVQAAPASCSELGTFVRKAVQRLDVSLSFGCTTPGIRVPGYLHLGDTKVHLRLEVRVRLPGGAIPVEGQHGRG
eukprot:1507187-Rhodomonas_salina.6